MSSLRKVTNQSDFQLSYIKLEDRNNNGNIAANDVGTMDVWFPWVDNPGQFASKVLVIEVIGLSRIYLWESGEFLWYCISDKYMEGPFNRHSKISVNGDEFSQGKIVPGDAGRANKELEVRNKGNEIFIKMYNC